MIISRSLVIGDPHDTPEESKTRFDIASNVIEAERPDNIVMMGDFNTLDSITRWNEGKPLYKEGKRLSDDLDSGIEAYQRLMASQKRMANRASVLKKRKYRPNLYWLEANHERRILDYIIQHPELQGFIPESDLVGAAADGWKVVPYKQYIYIRGVGFTHVPHFYSGNPIGGKYITRRALELNSNSIVFGHRHILAVDEWAREGEAHSKTTALCVGWFGDYVPHYTVGGTSHKQWWSGLVMLTHYDYGLVDIHTMSMQRLYNEYL